jgi:uncharacterized protein
MSQRLPKIIDPLHLADKRGTLKGCVAVSGLSRLDDVLADKVGEVAVALAFSHEGRYAQVEGTLQVELRLCCQNCLQPVKWPINHTIKLGIVKTIEQADRLPDGIEPLLLEGDSVLLQDLIEDELLLLLPTYPKHTHDCLGVEQSSSTSHKPSNGQSRRDNPFSILANLKTTGEP